METAFSTDLGDSRARLHHVIDQIQSEAVLQAALLLLLPQAGEPMETTEPENPAWLRELDHRLETYDAHRNTPLATVLERLGHDPQ